MRTDIIEILEEVDNFEDKFSSYEDEFIPQHWTITNNREFIVWREKAKECLFPYKSNEYVAETITLMESFRAFFEKEDYWELCARIHNIIEHIKENALNKNSANTYSQLPSVFVSYNESSGADFVRELKTQISEKADLHIYKDDVQAWESLKNFMKTIRHQDFAILVITDQYLKSEACLYEITELTRDDNWEEKTIFCVLDNSIYDKNKHLEYIEYWCKQADTLDKRINQIPNSASSSQCERLKHLRHATDEIGQFLEKVSDSKNPNQYSASRIIAERLEGVHNE